VPYQLVALQHDIPPYKKGYIWADPSLAEAARWMRWVYEHPREAQALGAKAQQHVRRVLSPEAAAQRMAQRFEEIQQLRGAVPEREKGTSLNSTSLTPKSFASRVYVHVPEAPSPHLRSISGSEKVTSLSGRRKGTSLEGKRDVTE